MPYIPEAERKRIGGGVCLRIHGRRCQTVGELTWALTDLIHGFYGGSTPSFTLYSSVLAALEATKLEFYRRMVAPYEEGACERNGDVF